MSKVVSWGAFLLWLSSAPLASADIGFDGGGGGSATPITAYAIVTRTGDQAITNDSITVIAFDSEIAKSGVTHDTVTNNGRLTVVTEGLYEIKAMIRCELPAATKVCELTLRKNGVVGVYQEAALLTAEAGSAAVGNANYLNVNVIDYLYAGDYYEAMVYHNAGANRNVVLTDYSPRFSLMLVAPVSGSSGAGAFTPSSSDTLTNKVYNAESSGNTIYFPVKTWLPTAYCQNTTTGLLWDSPTANAAAPGCVTGTNTQKGVADFDATTDESLQLTLLLPADWTTTGTIDAQFVWFAVATTGSVTWGIQLSCVSDAETDDPSFNVSSVVSDAAKGTTLQTNTASVTSISNSGCSAGDLLHVKIYRDANGSEGTDDMANDARLIGVELTYRRAL